MPTVLLPRPTPRRQRFALFASIGCALAAPGLPAQIASRVISAQINEARVLVLPTTAHNIVTLRASLPVGDALARADGGNPAITTLVGEMLDQGTTRRDRFEIADALDSRGARLSFTVHNDYLLISGRCLRQDLRLFIELLIEQLRFPAFVEDQFDSVKIRLIGALQQSMEDPDQVAAQAFNNAIFPPSHPNHRIALPNFIRATHAATLETARAFHRQHYGPRGMIVVFVGDVAGDEVFALLQTATAGWRGGTDRQTQPSAARRLPPAEPAMLAVPMVDKTSVSVLWGQSTGLTAVDADALPLELATAVLGQGFTGRLLARIRDTEGLTYGIEASLDDDTFHDGSWSVHGSFAPSLLSEGIASTRREILAWWRDGITAEELADRKTNRVGIFKLRLATTGGLAGTILNTIHRGETLDRIDDYPSRVDALTLPQVNGAIRTHLDPARMVLVTAGAPPEHPASQ